MYVSKNIAIHVYIFQSVVLPSPQKKRKEKKKVLMLHRLRIQTSVVGQAGRVAAIPPASGHLH